jgi:hypothetical protein
MTRVVTPTPIGDPAGFVKYQLRGAQADIWSKGMKKVAEATITDRGKSQYTLSVFRSGVQRHAEWVLWTLVRNGRKALIGAGRLVRYTGAPMQEKYAAVEARYQKKGLYSAIIVALRRILRTPIESDKSVSEGAIGAWKKAGAKVSLRDGEPVYRMNPSGKTSKSGRRSNACKAIAALTTSIQTGESSLAMAVRVFPYDMDTNLEDCDSNAMLLGFVRAYGMHSFMWLDLADHLTRTARRNIAERAASAALQVFVKETTEMAYYDDDDDFALASKDRASWESISRKSRKKLQALWSFQRARGFGSLVNSEEIENTRARMMASAMESIVGKDELKKILISSMPKPLTPREIVARVHQ